MSKYVEEWLLNFLGVYISAALSWIKTKIKTMHNIIEADFFFYPYRNTIVKKRIELRKIFTTLQSMYENSFIHSLIMNLSSANSWPSSKLAYSETQVPASSQWGGWDRIKAHSKFCDCYCGWTVSGVGGFLGRAVMPPGKLGPVQWCATESSGARPVFCHCCCWELSLPGDNEKQIDV